MGVSRGSSQGGQGQMTALNPKPDKGAKLSGRPGELSWVPNIPI